MDVLFTVRHLVLIRIKKSTYAYTFKEKRIGITSQTDELAGSICISKLLPDLLI